MPKLPVKRVVFQPQSYEGVQRGVNQIAAAISPTLGPLPRFVANQPDRGTSNLKPEILDDGAIIARRIIQLEDRDDDVGAMFLRNVLWRLHENVGDGTATAAVLFGSILNNGVRFVAAGGDPMGLRRHLEDGLRVLLVELDKQIRPLEGGKEQLAKIAQSICYDPTLAKLLGEIFDIIGEYGRLEIRTGRGLEHEREYVEGSYWEGGFLSRHFMDKNIDPRIQLENVHILNSDLEIDDPSDLTSLMEIAIAEGVTALVIVANKLSESALALLLANQGEDMPMQILAVKTPPSIMGNPGSALEDLTIITGGRAFQKVTGDTLRSVKAEHFGQARKIWADNLYFGIVAGKGDPHRLREHILSLKRAHSNADSVDAKEQYQERIGKLMGGSATLWISGVNEIEVDERKALAARAAAVLRGAVREGVLPGGGTALLNCRPALENLISETADEDRRFAYRTLLDALEAPLRTILENAGYEPAEYMREINSAPQGFGFDVLTGNVVNLLASGILDVATTQKAALSAAVSSAALALTIETIVHHKSPQLALTPK